MKKPLLSPPYRKKSKSRKLAFWAVGLFLFYTIVGFFILPPIIRSVASKKLSAQLGREVTIQQVKVNPFALSGTIRGLLIKEKNGDPFLSWDEVYGNFQLASFFGHPWVFKEIRTSQPFVHVQMNGDGTFNFSDILTKFSTNAPPKAPTGPAKQLAVRIDQIEIAGAMLSLKRGESVTNAGAVSVAVTKVPETTNTTDAILLLLQSVTNGFAAFSQITNSFAASSSKLGMDGQIRLRSPSGSLPEVTFTGDTWLNDFNTVDGVLGEPLLKWDSVHISGIDAALNPPVVAVKQVAVSGAYARLIIETNRTINLLAALRIANTNAALETPAEQSTSAQKAKKLLAGDTVISTNALAQLPLKKLSVGSVVITNTSANFTDRSVTPNVNMAVQQINGIISGISSEELQHADVSLHAKVDNVGPVEITGAINPFSKDQTNEIKIAVNDVDLTPASPYAGKFAGYRIAKGKLSVALAYHLHGRNLKSENVITLDQFTFGEKVNSPDATHLPVRLGIAVLKDRNGKIVLDVPIEGSLDDPQFRLHKVIVRALWNVVEKAITSPFAVLGAMFGGKGEEISYQDFAAGSADVTPASKEKLDVLVKALYERPGLQLEISGSVDTNADIGGLRTLYLEKQLRAQKWQALRKVDREATTPDQVAVTPEERPDLLKKLYADALSKGLILVSSNATAGGNPAKPASQPAVFQKTVERGATQLMAKKPAPIAAPQSVDGSPATGTADPTELALLNSISVADDDFQALAAKRAKAVREYILQSGKVEAERLFLTEDKTASLKTDGPRVYLQLQ
jgi:hypothetical protein